MIGLINRLEQGYDILRHVSETFKPLVWFVFYAIEMTCEMNCNFSIS